MAYAFVATSGVIDGLTGTTTAHTPAVALAAGIRAYVVVVNDTSGTVSVSSVTDNATPANTYTRVGTDVIDTGNLLKLSLWESQIANPATTVTATYSGSCAAHRISVTQYTGVTGASISAKAYQSAGTLTTDGITSGTLTPGSQPGLLFSYVFSSYNNVATAGTGFTSRGTVGGQQDAVEDRLISSLSAVAGTWTYAATTGSYDTIAAYAPLAATVSPRPTNGWIALLKSLGHFSSTLLNSVATYLAQDIGVTGWTIPTPTPVTGAPSTWSGVTQNGSRIFYVDPVNGNDSTGSLYFMYGGTLCDPIGASVGAGSVAYGTDPLNPSGPILPFKTYARVAPKNGADWTDNVQTQIGSFVPSPTRVGFPDYTLFKRGTTLSLYSDMRAFLDGTARTTTGVYLYGGCLVTGGGRSSTEKAVIGAYGPASAGRARVIDPIYQTMALGGGSARSYELTFGLMIDDMARDRAVRPLDWASITTHDMQMVGAQYLSLGPSNIDLRIEDCMFWGTAGMNIQWAATHTGTPVLGMTFYRNVIVDSYDEASSSLAEARKDSADPNQTFTAGTTTQVTWPTLHSGANFAASAYTTVATGYFALWYQIDLTVACPTNGTIEVVPFLNGVEIAGASVSAPGTSASLATYQLHGLLRTGNLTATGQVLTVSIRTTNATGTVTVLGAAGSRLVVEKINFTGCQGIYLQAAPATQFSISQNVLIRNGFGTNPTKQGTFFPNAGVLPYDWDIFNHNIYSVGDCDVANCHIDDNILIVGAAGPVFRTDGTFDRNFIYEGYFGPTPEHRYRAYTVTAGSMNDNVMQKFVGGGGHNGVSHPGDGMSTSNGTYGFQIRRNIVSDVAVGATGRGAVGVGANSTPYWPPNALFWVNDTANTVIDGNIFDCANTGYYAYSEANGATYDFLRFHAPITGVIATGNAMTCTPTAGYSGTPTYQWYKYQNGSNVPAIITGETAATYILRTAATGIGGTIDWANAAFSGQPDILVSCVVSGIVYPAGTGISGTTVTNNTWVTTGYGGAGTFASMKTYFNTNSAGGNSAISGTPGSTATPTTSDTAFTSTTNPMYATRSAAGSALSWPNPEASLKSHLTGLGLIVATADGAQELYNVVLGATPITTAQHRGQWDGRLMAKAIGNHVRAGRNMAVLP